jgi:PAS domain S-box-containing protein
MRERTLQPAIDHAELVRAAGDAMIACNADGHIVLWNPAAERIFGFSQEEALGHSLDLIIPERQRQRHWDGYHQTMRTGQTRYATNVLRVPALHKDGRSLSIAFTVALLKAPDGSPSAIIAIVRDETERFAEERKLRKELAELQSRLRQTAAG